MAKNIKKDKTLGFFAALSAVLCVCALAGGFYVSQTDELYYGLEKSQTVEISSADDITELGDAIYNNYCILTADIYISDGSFCIGSGERPFEGTFDGNGHTIYLNYSAGGQNTSLFGCIESSGVVKNTKFVFSGVTVAGSTYGGIAKINYGTVQDCIIECANLTIDNNAGIYSPCVTINNGTISNVVVDCAFSNARVYESESSILFGSVCTYNYGIVKNCIASVSYTNFNSCDEFKILTGDATNVGIGAICAVTTNGASTTNSVAVLADGVYTSDKNSGVEVVESFNDILNEESIFFDLDFSNQVWIIHNNELMLIEG